MGHRSEVPVVENQEVGRIVNEGVIGPAYVKWSSSVTFVQSEGETGMRLVSIIQN